MKLGSPLASSHATRGGRAASPCVAQWRLLLTVAMTASLSVVATLMLGAPYARLRSGGSGGSGGSGDGRSAGSAPHAAALERSGGAGSSILPCAPCAAAVECGSSTGSDSDPGRPRGGGGVHAGAEASRAVSARQSSSFEPLVTADGFALAMGASPWDEHDLYSLPHDAASEELGGAGSGVFRHMVVDPACPLFVTPQYHGFAGMSHRFSNYVMALIAAQVLDVALLAAPFDYRSSQHGNYSGMDAFFGVSAGEWSEAEAMARWPNLTRIDLPRLDNWARYELGGMFSPASRTSVWPQKRASLTRKCHIIFNVLPDDWLTDPKPATKWLLAKKWARHVPSLPLALRTLAFRAADVNIAVHFRTGDMTPTTEAWHVEVLARTVLPALADAVAEGTRLVVHIFLQNDKDHRVYTSFPSLLRNAGGLADALLFHPSGDMSAFPTFLHLTQADVLLQSRSAFSEYAAHLSSRPLSFAAWGSRFGARYQQCGVATICCRATVPGSPEAGNFTEGDMCPSDARWRLQRVLQRRGLLRTAPRWPQGGVRGGGTERAIARIAPAWPPMPGYG